MRDGLILHAVEGAVGGILGTVALQQALRHSFRMPERIQPPEMRTDPGDFIVERVERASGHPLAEPIHHAMARSLPWVYGAGWGIALGVFASKAKIRSTGQTLAAGAAMGALVWAVGYAGWLPATGLTRPVHRQGGGHVINALLTHVGYGLLAAAPIALIDRIRERRSARVWRTVRRLLG